MRSREMMAADVEPVGGKQIDPRIPEWAVGREMSDKRMYGPRFAQPVWA